MIETITTSKSPVVVSGHVTVLRLFDLAFGIDLVKAEALWASQLGQGARSKLTRTPKKAVDFGEAPLTLRLSSEDVTLMNGLRESFELKATVVARLYAFGVVSLALQIKADNLPWKDYSERVNAVEEAIGPKTDATVWSTILDKLFKQLNNAFIRPNNSQLVEDYLVATVHRFDEPILATNLGNEIDLVPLLSGETAPLSDTAKADLLSRRFSYFVDDLVVLTWDRVFIYEPHHATDVAEVLEIANAQFLQMRYYDELLDAELPKMYNLVEEATRRHSLGPRRFATLARRLYTLVAEVTELSEKVENALQVTEDVYLARIYAAALELFRVKSVSDAVDRKLAIIRDTYSALYDEAAHSRTGLMEVAVIVLIFVEVVFGLLHFL